MAGKNANIIEEYTRQSTEKGQTDEQLVMRYDKPIRERTTISSCCW